MTYSLFKVLDCVRGAYFHDAFGRIRIKILSQTTAMTMTGTRVETSEDAELEFSSAP